ncbi:hypothetical protein PPYR_06189 [Photinus pyralis]|uniref:aralkylamine N-acetyltransferase n=1 Tax=Photinus pyralis TaxID=7054 RepID=A0A5N4AT08_PHOPY|nr:uncharacterized protein LOC116167241 [Photinus pyralis]KAB0800449.1 hypothetical protein PPYR_06189 [Photinus pyralis]
MRPFIQTSKLCSIIRHTKTWQRTIWGRKRKKPEEKPFLIVPAHRQEYPCIVEMMWTYYYPNEPTISSLGLGHTHNPFLDEEALSILREGYSFVAKCKYTGEIVGASLNSSSCPWNPDEMDAKAKTIKDSKLRDLYHFYAHMTRAPLLWQKFCTNKIFLINMVFVRHQDRNRGVSTNLLDTSRKFGADCGYSVIRCNATNIYTAKICENLKMKLVHSIPYCSYIGSNPAQTPLIRAPPPHTELRVYVDLPLFQYK